MTRTPYTVARLAAIGLLCARGAGCGNDTAATDDADRLDQAGDFSSAQGRHS